MENKILIVLTLAFVFASCLDDDGYENYYYSLGVYDSTGDGIADFQVNLDNGSVLIPVEISGNLKKYDDEARVIVYYTMLNDDSGSNDTLMINSKIHQIEEVLTKDVIVLTDEISDSIGNDPIYVHEEDIWISKNFLNVYFYYYWYNQVHYVNMIKYPNDSVDDEGRLLLEFRHNSNNDPYDYTNDGLVCFDMNSLQRPGIDSLPFVVKIIDYEGDSMFWKDTYYFNESIGFSKNVEIQNNGSLIK
jgi:hypothetical protein